MAISFTGEPVDDILLSKIDSPIGTYRQSDLTPAQFNTQTPGTWVLADGGDVTGSEYEAITGKTNAPDARSRYLRSKDHAAGINPDGDLSEGSYQDDVFKSHNHDVQGYYNNGVSTQSRLGMFTSNNGLVRTTTSNTTGDSETRPKTLIVNTYIKINHT